MATHRLHYITNQGLNSYVAVRGTLQHDRQFSATLAGEKDFNLWLSENHTGLHTVLVELADEEFHSESIPWAIGSDRKSLIYRKLVQRFFGSPYATCLSLGRERDGRRDERVLLTAITSPETLEPWIGALRKHEVAISAIHSVPLLTKRLITCIKPEARHGLILLLSPAGIRQIYFQDGELRFSRLSPAPETAYSNWAPACLRETQKTYQYLTGQRWFLRGGPLRVSIVLHSEDIESVMAKLASTDNLEFDPINLQVLAQRLGMRETITSSDSLPIMMQVALRGRRTTQLASSFDRRFYRFRQAQTAIITTSVLSFVMCGLTATKCHLDSLRFRQETTQASSDTRREAARYEQLLASFPAMPTSFDTLRNIVDGFDQLSSSRADPEQALVQLSDALVRFPDIDVQSIDWHEEEDLEGNTAAASDADSAHSMRISRHHSTTLNARLSGESAIDPRAAMERIQAFLEEVRKHSSGEVHLLKQPLDVASDKILKGGIEALDRPAEFQLRLTLKRGAI